MTNQQRNSTISFSLLTLLVFIGSLFFSKELTKATQLLSFAQSVSNQYVNSTLPFKNDTVGDESRDDDKNTLDKVATSSDQSSTNSGVLVTKVTDGDTITLETGEKLRYIGINTPELHSPFKGKECFGEEAHAANVALVSGKRIRMEKDISETDKYDRLLRYVWVDGVFVNEKLVKEGFAFAKDYPPDSKYKAVFEAAQEEAQNKKAGLWTKCPVH